MSSRIIRAVFAATVALCTVPSIGQSAPPGKQTAAEKTRVPQDSTEQRAAATRAFLGLGPEPDKAAAARGAPMFEKSCAVCHGQKARGAMGPNLITSDQVLTDNHGEHLVPYIKAGVPGKGMPSFSGMREDELRDIAEFLHLQVEEVANRGAYEVRNIVVGDPAKGQAYVAAHCMQCHTADTFLHIRTRFANPEQLQRYWIWPAKSRTNSAAITATVKAADGTEISGRVVRVSDFRIDLVDRAGNTHTIDRKPGVDVEFKDLLAPHQQLLMTLKNSDMHDVTAYLDSLK